jgi:hypothetical protein
LHDDSQLQSLVRDRLGLRIGPEMIKYLAARLAASPDAFPIMGADARTGAPVRQMVDPRVLVADTNSVTSLDA